MPVDDGKWMLYLSHAVRAYQLTGEIPYGSRHPGGWVGAQRSAARRQLPSMTAERQALLDRHLPGWREGRPVELPRPWTESAALVVLHAMKHKRLPRQNAAEASERSLALWLSVQRGRFHRGEMPEEQRAWLDSRVPDWKGAGPRDAAWLQAAEDLGAFVRSATRWPNKRSDDPAERRLGYWLKNRRDDHRAGRLSAARAAMLDELAPGWTEPAASGGARST